MEVCYRTPTDEYDVETILLNWKMNREALEDLGQRITASRQRQAYQVADGLRTFVEHQMGLQVSCYPNATLITP